MAVFTSILGLPERAFRDEKIYRVSLPVLMLGLFLIHVTGSELIGRFYATPYVAGLTAQQIENSSRRFVFAPPHSESRPVARTVVPWNPTFRAVGVVLRSILFVTAALVLWWILIIFVQFLGGEEERTAAGLHRNSRYLVFYSWFPLAFRRLLEGIFIQFQDPAAAWSAANVSAYRRQSAVSFSLLSGLGLRSLPAPLSFLAYNLTDPFFLWFLFIIMYGGKTVFHLSEKSSFLVAGFAVLVIYLLRTLSGAIGISMGV